MVFSSITSNILSTDYGLTPAIFILGMFSTLWILMTTLSHLDNRSRKGHYSYSEQFKLFVIRRRAPKLVLRRFKEVFEQELAKLEVSPETALYYNVHKEISQLRKVLDEPLSMLRGSAHKVWSDKNWKEFISLRPGYTDEPESELYGRTCSNSACRRSGHNRCRFSLDLVTSLDVYQVLLTELRSRLARLESDWLIWESKDSSFKEVSALIGQNPKYLSPRVEYRYAFNPDTEKVLISCRLAVHVKTALDNLKTAQRVVYRHTLKSGPLFEHLSQTKASNPGTKSPQSLDLHVALVSRPVAYYAYLENNLWFFGPENAVSGDGLDMEVFLMLWSKSSETMPLAKIVSGSRAIVRGETASQGYIRSLV
jgi:hypothetical protein